jgi:hypothetical protein
MSLEDRWASVRQADNPEVPGLARLDQWRSKDFCVKVLHIKNFAIQVYWTIRQ